MIALLEDPVGGALLVGLIVAGVVFVVRAVALIRRRRLHRRRANQWFMAGYRAGHRHASRSTVDRGRHSA